MTNVATVGAERDPTTDRASVSEMVDSTVCVLQTLPEGQLKASGFAVGGGDWILTTAHGLDPSLAVQVKLSDGRVFPARLERIGDERLDLAILSTSSVELEPVRFRKAATLTPGEEVSAVGCPLDFEFTVTRGVVSALRDDEALGHPLIQSDVPVSPGSSGSALFDSRGRVVGVIKAAFVDGERIHFALPADLAEDLVADVLRGHRALEFFNRAVLEPRLDDKIRLYRRALSEQPALFEARYNLALALDRAGNTNEAASAYRKALDLDPDSERIHLNFGAMLHVAKQYDEAIEIFREGLQRNPTSIRLRNNLGESLRMSGRLEEARKEFQTAVDAAPDSSAAHYNLALACVQMDDSSCAVGHFERYLEIEPNAAESERIQAWITEQQAVP